MNKASDQPKMQKGEDVNFPRLGTYELIHRSAEKQPDGAAITFMPSGHLETPPIKLSHSEFIEDITRTANAFYNLGIRRDDTVAFLLPNMMETQFTFWGAQAVGRVNPINYLLDVDSITQILIESGAKILVALGPHPSFDIWNKVEAVRTRVPTLRTIVRVGGISKHKDDALSFEEITRAAQTESLLGDQAAAEDIAAIFHTGGTTGAPKLVAQTHQNQVFAAWGAATLLQMKQTDTLMNGLPFFHVAAPILLTLAPLSVGAEVLMMTPSGLRDPLVLQNFWRIIEHYKVTLPGGVPTSLLQLLRVPIGAANISSARLVLTGGGALPSVLAKEFEQHCGIPTGQIYGMTETAGLITATPGNGPYRHGTVGIPPEHVEVFAMRDDQSRCSPGEQGVLCVNGPNVATSILTQHENGDPLSPQEFLATGDLGHVDENGWVYVTGRRKDVIIRSAHNIDPVTIEYATNSHPAVSTSVAVGCPDAHSGEVPVVFVTLKEGQSVDPSVLLKFVCARVPEPPAKPTQLYIIAKMPLTAIGKIYRPKLREEAAVRFIEGELINILGPPPIVFANSEGGTLLEIIVQLAPAQSNEAKEVREILKHVPIPIVVRVSKD